MPPAPSTGPRLPTLVMILRGGNFVGNSVSRERRVRTICTCHCYSMLVVPRSGLRPPIRVIHTAEETLWATLPA